MVRGKTCDFSFGQNAVQPTVEFVFCAVQEVFLADLEIIHGNLIVPLQLPRPLEPGAGGRVIMQIDIVLSYHCDREIAIWIQIFGVGKIGCRFGFPAQPIQAASAAQLRAWIERIELCAALEP